MCSDTVLHHDRRRRPGTTPGLALLTALLLVALHLHLHHTQRRLAEARELLNTWDLVAAEQLLAELLEKNPNRLEVRRLYSEVALKRGNLTAARNTLASLTLEDSLLHTKHLLSLAETHFFLGHLDSAATIVHDVMGRVNQPARSLDSSALARCYHLLGRIAFNKGAYDSARTLQTVSLFLARQRWDLQTEADALRQLGVLAWYAGKPDSARTFFYEPALALYRHTGDRSGEATILSNLGHLDDGLASQLRAFVLRKRIGDQIGLADSYYFLSPFTDDERLTNLAYAYRRKSFDLSARIGYAWGREVAARALTELLFHAFDEHTIGTPLYDSSFVTSSEGRIHDLLWRGTALARKGEWRNAAHLQERAIHLCDSLGYTSGLSVAYGSYAISLMELGDLDGAERAAVRSYASFRDDMGVGNILLAEVLIRKENYRHAFRLLSNAAQTFDERYAEKSAKPEFSFQVGWLTHKRFQLYSRLVSAAVGLGEGDSLFQVMERYCSLLYSVGDPTTDARNGEYEYLWSKFRSLLQHIDDVSPDECDRLVEEFIKEYADAMNHQTRYVGIIQRLRTLHIPSLREIQHALEPQDVLLHFFVGENDVCVLAIQRNLSRIVRLAVSSRQLADVSRTLHETILRGAAQPTDTLWTSSAIFLYQQLLAPLEREGLLRPRVIISPSGILHTVPFAALLEPDKRGKRRFLVEQYELCYVPSGARLMRQHDGDGTPAQSLAVVPDQASLPFAEKEVHEIPETIFTRRTILLDAEASSTRVLDEIPRHNWIHIAAHGKSVPHAPLHSYLQLADRRVELAEILTRKLPPLTIILSACETGAGAGMAGDLSKGHVVVSFPIAFLISGAAAVVSPMWLVHDEAAFLLISRFYAYLSKDDIHKRGLARALAAAQRDFLHSAFESDKFNSHPFYWAGYYVVGRDMLRPQQTR